MADADTGQVAEWRHAYTVLGVPPDASALAIKQAYRRLVKRWHPDLYESGTSAHAEALELTRRINQAYACITRAPLRYYREPSPPPSSEPPAAPRSTRPYDTSGYGTPLPSNADKIEYSVRFVSGCVAGIFLCLDAAAVFFDAEFFDSRWKQLTLLFSVVTLLCGWGAARYGDKFWHAVFRRWWF